MLDTVVFVRCLLNPRSLWGRLVLEYAGAYQLVVSEPVRRETIEVLNRPRLARRFRFVAGMDRGTVLAILAAAEVVEAPDPPPFVSRDPTDDKFLAAARAATAYYLVTEDHDPLVLGRYEGTRLVDGLTFLRVLEENRATDE